MTKTTIAKKPVLALILTSFVLVGCGTVRESRLNPFNWFGGSREVATTPDEEANPLVPRERSGIFSRPDEVYAGIPIDQITDLRIERTRTGAIILVEGIAARQGPYDVQLTPATLEDEPVDGVLSYSFDIVYPTRETAIGPERTRRVTVAHSISADVLSQVRVIRVEGARNARETRRR
ncbi:hypothetical protein [Aestuariivita sp.]|uniref:hypothetical protein n=1 Tax=Aestuariivita sp. TaxID=1872407 RepID=UPI00216D2366|nr:hypothetical protein [Aestuariivita sp.]MCE8006418.1 hypothetical protein [Aestuariivita sp.]